MCRPAETIAVTFHSRLVSEAMGAAYEAARSARPVDSSQRLGRHRWVVERTLGWLLSYKRLALRYDRTALTMTALARLAAVLICARRLPAD